MKYSHGSMYLMLAGSKFVYYMVLREAMHKYSFLTLFPQPQYNLHLSMTFVIATSHCLVLVLYTLCLNLFIYLYMFEFIEFIILKCLSL